MSTQDPRINVADGEGPTSERRVIDINQKRSPDAPGAKGDGPGKRFPRSEFPGSDAGGFSNMFVDHPSEIEFQVSSANAHLWRALIGGGVAVLFWVLSLHLILKAGQTTAALGSVTVALAYVSVVVSRIRSLRRLLGDYQRLQGNVWDRPGRILASDSGTRWFAIFALLVSLALSLMLGFPLREQPIASNPGPPNPESGSTGDDGFDDTPPPPTTYFGTGEESGETGGVPNAPAEGATASDTDEPLPEQPELTSDDAGSGEGGPDGSEGGATSATPVPDDVTPFSDLTQGDWPTLINRCFDTGLKGIPRRHACNTAGWRLFLRKDPRAVELLYSACRLRSGRACHTLGSAYLHGGYGVEKDRAMAQEQFRVACDLKFWRGCGNLAFETWRNASSNVERNEAYSLYRKACLGDQTPPTTQDQFRDPWSCQQLGFILRSESRSKRANVKTDVVLAVECLAFACRNDEARACSALDSIKPQE